MPEPTEASLEPLLLSAPAAARSKQYEAVQQRLSLLLEGVLLTCSQLSVPSSHK